MTATQLKGAFMSDQVVLITGALTGIGRAAAIIFAQEGHELLCLAVETKKDKRWLPSYKGSEQRPFLSVLMSARMRTCATLWTKPSSVSDAWIGSLPRCRARVSIPVRRRLHSRSIGIPMTLASCMPRPSTKPAFPSSVPAKRGKPEEIAQAIVGLNAL
jgi:hypothetical protein